MSDSKGEGDRKKLQILTHLIQENISMCANFVCYVLLVFIWIFMNKIKQITSIIFKIRNTRMRVPCCQDVNKLIWSRCSHCVEDREWCSGPQHFQSKVGPLVGLLLESRGWLPIVLAWGPWFRAESSAGAERWWNAAFCWWKLFM